MPPILKEIVIVGGGSAGWMTAAALSSLLDPKDVSITLVESDEIGAIGVGEATIPDILNFNRILGIREDEFMKATQATFKLGIEFVDWGRKGDVYIHPFGQHGVDMRGIDFHQYWMHSHAAGNARPIQQYSLCAVAAKQNKFSLPDPDPRSVLSVIQLSRASYRKMKQNLWWAAGYNVISVPLAAGVLAPIGFVLPMSVGAILMSASTVVVALNAQVLRRLDLSPEASIKAVF